MTNKEFDELFYGASIPNDEFNELDEFDIMFWGDSSSDLINSSIDLINSYQLQPVHVANEPNQLVQNQELLMQTIKAQQAAIDLLSQRLNELSSKLEVQKQNVPVVKSQFDRPVNLLNVKL